MIMLDTRDRVRIMLGIGDRVRITLETSYRALGIE